MAQEIFSESRPPSKQSQRKLGLIDLNSISINIASTNETTPHSDQPTIVKEQDLAQYLADQKDFRAGSLADLYKELKKITITDPHGSTIDFSQFSFDKLLKLSKEISKIRSNPGTPPTSSAALCAASEG